MKINISRCLPMEVSWERERNGIILGLALTAGWSLGIPMRYLSALSELYTTVGGQRVLRQSARIEPFPQLVGGGLDGLLFYLAGLAALVFWHYLTHYMGSRSIYLMKRLPDRWELHRRCWTVPVAAAALGLVLMGLLMGLYYLIYRLCTPAQCLI